MSCPHCADAAGLRQAFYTATAAFQVYKNAGLPKDHPAIGIWGQLYAAVRDSTAGLEVIRELERARAEIATLKEEIVRLKDSVAAQ